MVTKSSKSKSSKKSSKPSKPAASKSAGKSSKKAGSKSSKKAAAKPSKKTGGASGSRPASFRSAASRNGLRSFAMHRGDSGSARVVSGLRPPAGAAADEGFEGLAAAVPSLTALDPERAARHFLNNALASEHVPEFEAAEVSGEGSEFKLIATEAVPLTGTQTVKFSQQYRKTPVYGALVTVELDKKNELVSINSALSEPTNVDAVASVSPADALRRVRERAGYASNEHLDATPRLYYYFDRPAQRWRLVYITRDVPRLKAPDAPAADAPPPSPALARHRHARRMPQIFDYVVDAHSGELVAELPRSQSVTVTAPDARGRPRKFVCTQNGAGHHLYDPQTNVHTYDFGFRNVFTNLGKLPGDYVGNPPAPWNPSAVSAHANAAEVLRFIKSVLKRNGLDNLGGPIRSSINCVEATGAKVWDNAMWYRDQMMYGQSRVGTEFRSWALAKDIVAHELTHGLTDYTARLEYLGESGALNESYADIFGVILANEEQANVGKWNWLIGANIMGDSERDALRSMKRPRDFDQPDHMDRYEKLSNTEADDWGGVHINSGIHNKAAFNLLTTKGSNGKHLFKPREVAALFYIALTQHLSRTSRFADSRRGVELAARSLFANRSNRNTLFRAVARAFDRVGIV